MTILVLNCGSSSIKYQVIEMRSGAHELLAKGLVERIGQKEGVLTHRPARGERYEIRQAIHDHTVGIDLILGALIDPRHGVIASLGELHAVGHRVAHGGEYFSASAVVTPEVIERIRSCFDLAPLHNPANLQGILSIAAILPAIPQVAVFDTSFHQTMPPESYLYALPYRYYVQYRVRKYGFHGTSHKYVARRGAALAGIDQSRSRIITCHIGNGASVTAIRDGRSLDTSMGFTPVDGLVMGTRSGEVDPGALIYIAQREGLSYDELSAMINKESGMQGLTGISSDMRDIDAACEQGDERAIVARKIYFGRVKEFVGAYAARMGGVDLIVFTGGVGENSPELREAVCSGMEFMGLRFDRAANAGLRGRDALLSAADSAVKVVVVATDEELVIASDTYALTGGEGEASR